MGASQSAQPQFEPVAEAPSPVEESHEPSGPRLARNYFLLHPLRTETSFPATDALTRRRSPAPSPHGSPSPAPRRARRSPERADSSRYRGLFDAVLAPSEIHTPVVTTAMSSEQNVGDPTVGRHAQNGCQNGCHVDISSCEHGDVPATVSATHWSAAAVKSQAILMIREVDRAASRVADREAANEAARAASRAAEGQARWGERPVRSLVHRDQDIAEEIQIRSRAGKLPDPATLPQPDAEPAVGNRREDLVGVPGRDASSSSGGEQQQPPQTNQEAIPLLDGREARSSSGSSNSAGQTASSATATSAWRSGAHCEPCALCLHHPLCSPACDVASTAAQILMSRVVPLLVAIGIPIGIGWLASAAAYSTMTICFASSVATFGILCFLVTPLSDKQAIEGELLGDIGLISRAKLEIAQMKQRVRDARRNGLSAVQSAVGGPAAALMRGGQAASGGGEGRGGDGGGGGEEGEEGCAARCCGCVRAAVADCVKRLVAFASDSLAKVLQLGMGVSAVLAAHALAINAPRMLPAAVGVVGFCCMIQLIDSLAFVLGIGLFGWAWVEKLRIDVTAKKDEIEDACVDAAQWLIADTRACAVAVTKQGRRTYAGCTGSTLPAASTEPPPPLHPLAKFALRVVDSTGSFTRSSPLKCLVSRHVSHSALLSERPQPPNCIPWLPPPCAD